MEYLTKNRQRLVKNVQNWLKTTQNAPLNVFNSPGCLSTRWARLFGILRYRQSTIFIIENLILCGLCEGILLYCLRTVSICLHSPSSWLMVGAVLASLPPPYPHPIRPSFFTACHTRDKQEVLCVANLSHLSSSNKMLNYHLSHFLLSCHQHSVFSLVKRN